MNLSNRRWYATYPDAERISPTFSIDAETKENVVKSSSSPFSGLQTLHDLLTLHTQGA